MSEQTLQAELYSIPVSILDNYICYSLGATTIKDLLQQDYISGVPTSVNLGKKPDVLIVDKDKHIIVFIEFKKPTEFDSKAKIRKAINQELQVAKEIKAKIYVVTDGSKFIWINPLTENVIVDEHGNKLGAEIKPKIEEKKLAELINRVALTISSTNDKLYPIEDTDPTALAIRIGGILKNIKFSTPKDSLYTFVEIFLFKYLSDIGILSGSNSFEEIYKKYNNITDEEVLYRYLQGPREIMKLLFPIAKDNTTIINGTIFHAFIDSSGDYKCNGTDAKTFREILTLFNSYEKEHGKFLNISRDFKSKLFETFTKQEKNKQNAGKYFTPLKIVQGMVDMVDIRPGMDICDPACGVGKFLLEAALKIDEPFKFEKGHLKKRIHLYGFEKEMDEKGATSGFDLTTILAKANTLIYFSNIFRENNNRTDIQHIANELLNDTYYSSKSILGTLERLEPNKYDLILTNPPYYQSSIITNEAKGTKLYSEGGAGVEGLFVEWIIKSLKPGGTANIVVPDGIFLTMQNDRLHEYMLKTCYLECIISLPINTFFNTPKKTYVLTLTKKKDLEDTQNYPVFTYLCNSIGESLDVNRFDIEDNDFHEAVSKYIHYHHSDPNNLPQFIKDAIDSDGRLKLLPIESFKTRSGWNIDSRWSDEEKIALGFKKPQNIMTVGEFQNFIDDIMNQIADYRGALECLK